MDDTDFIDFSPSLDLLCKVNETLFFGYILCQIWWKREKTRIFAQINTNKNDKIHPILHENSHFYSYKTPPKS